MSRNLPASVKARLLNRASVSGEPFESFLVRYASERFLYRLGVSDHRDRCVLKGASLLSLWLDEPYRATRDIDLLTSGASDDSSIRELMLEVCSVSCPEDGLSFDPRTLEIEPIRAMDEYPGQRATIRATLGKARVRVQVDFGFGDVVVPGPEHSEYPTLLAGTPAPRLRTYPREMTIAEKFEAMIRLGSRNSRMKDFHDVWMLSSAFEFDGRVLQPALWACFERRRTKWTREVPAPLTSEFYTDPKLAPGWLAYRRGGAFQNPPPEDFSSVGHQLIEFLAPVRRSILRREPLSSVWTRGGPWRKDPT